MTKKTSDTISAIVDPNCSNIKVDSAMNGYWLVYSTKDSCTLLYSVRISSNKKQGCEYEYDPVLGRKTEYNYLDGKKNGFYAEYLYENKGKSKFYPQNNAGFHLVYSCNYYDGKKIGEGFYYNENGAVNKMVYYDVNGNVTKEKPF